MSPTLRQLETFVLVYRNRSITRAAAELHVSQSAVSMLIRELEAQFGVKLFDRTTRAVQPTVAAAQALQTAERILAETRGLSHHMRDLAQARVGRLVFLASAGVASALMPRVLAAFCAAHPEIAVELHDVTAGQFLSEMAISEGEFGIGSVQGDVVNMTIEPLVRGRLSAIGLRAGGFGSRRQMSWEELSELPTIAMRRDTLIRAQIDETLARQGKRLAPTFEVALINTALSMTAQGLGYSILPSYMLPEEQFPDLVAKPLIRPAMTRQVSLVRRAGRSLSPAAQSFLALARSMFRRDYPAL